MYLDCFLNIAGIEVEDAVPVIKKLDEIGTKFNVSIIISVTMDPDNVPEDLKDKVIASL